MMQEAHRSVGGVIAVQDLHMQAGNARAQRVVGCVAGGALDLGADPLPVKSGRPNCETSC
jgi:hypothetical protein